MRIHKTAHTIIFNSFSFLVSMTCLNVIYDVVFTGEAVQSESGRPRAQENAQTCWRAVQQRY